MYYNGFWWVGIAEDVSKLGIKVRFMLPHGTVKNLFWQNRDNKCWLLNSNVICLISMPTKISGQMYSISDLDLKNINRPQKKMIYN